MKAWLLDDFKGIERLRTAEVADPVCAPGEVVLRIHYAALNPADRYLAERQYPAKPPLPHILGRDGIGMVEPPGAAAAGAPAGERRAVLRGETGVTRPGTFAQRVALPAESLVEVPPDWTDQEAAGATLVYLTAYQALTMWGRLPQAGRVLISGASGGVGVAATQLGAAIGYTILGLSRSPEKRRRLKELGASEIFDPEDPRWREAAKAAAGSGGLELAIDNIGGKLLPEMIELLGDNGKVSLVGRLGGPVPNFNTASLFFRRIRLGGVAVGSYSNSEARASWREILRLLASTRARPQVDTVFPFDQLPQAFARLAQGPMGKVLLQVT